MINIKGEWKRTKNKNFINYWLIGGMKRGIGGNYATRPIINGNEGSLSIKIDYYPQSRKAIGSINSYSPPNMITYGTEKKAVSEMKKKLIRYYLTRE